MPLSNADRTKLIKLLGMLGSDFSGEVFNAAKAAQKIVKASGETWESILWSPPAPSGEPKQKPSYSRSDFANDAVRWLEEYASILSEWEKSFLASISTRFSLSEKQRKSFDRLADKIANYETCKNSDW